MKKWFYVTFVGRHHLYVYVNNMVYSDDYFFPRKGSDAIPLSFHIFSLM